MLNLILQLGNEKDVWLDYVIVIPEENYSPEILNQLPRDMTKEFFERCGQNNMHIDPSETGED